MVDIEGVSFRYDAEVSGLRNSLQSVTRDFKAIDTAADNVAVSSKRSLNSVEAGLRNVSIESSRATRSIQSFTNASNNSAKGLSGAVSQQRNFGLALQNTSFQIQDIAVQLASGTSLFQTLGQQLPQLIGGFGLLGAAIGAVVAVGGALLPVLVDMETASDKFDDTLKDLNDNLSAAKGLLKELEGGVLSVGKAYKEASGFQKELVRSDLSEAIRKGTSAIKEQAEALKNLGREQEVFNTIGGRDFRPSSAIGIFPSNGVSKQQGFELSQALKAFEDSEGGAQALRDLGEVLIRLREELAGTSPEFTELADNLLEAVESGLKTSEAVDQLKVALEDLNNISPETVDAMKSVEEAFDRAVASALEVAQAARKIIDEFQPATVASRDLDASINVLKDALLQNSITLEQYASAVGNLKKQYSELLDPSSKVVQALEKELSLLKLSKEQRTEQIALEKALAEARGIDGKLSGEQLIKIYNLVRAISSQNRENAEALKLAKDLAREETARLKQLDRAVLAVKKLIQTRKDTVDGLTLELSRQRDLFEAQELGIDAINRLTDAHEAEDLILKLKITSTSELATKIRSLVVEINSQKRATKDLAASQEESSRAAARAVQEQIQEQERLLQSIEDGFKDTFTSLFENTEEGFKGVFERVASRFRDLLIDLAFEAAARPIVAQFASSVIGGAALGRTGTSGVSGGAGSSGIVGALGAASNLIPTTGISLPTQIGLNVANSSVGQFFGLSKAIPRGGTALTSLGGNFVQGASNIGYGAFGSLGANLLGLSNANPLIDTGLSTAGSFIGGALGGPVGAVIGGFLGSTVGGFFGPGETSGPVGIADFSPGRGRNRAFNIPGIDPFTENNGGRGEDVRPIAEAIADLIEASADQFEATINETLRYRVARYDAGGAGRSPGFEVNAFLNTEIERRVGEGLSSEDALFEALNFAFTEAFTFDNSTIAEAVANMDVSTLEELFGALEFADTFQRLRDGFETTGEEVTALSLTLARSRIAIEDQGATQGREIGGALLESFRTVLELFPSQETGNASDNQVRVQDFLEFLASDIDTSLQIIAGTSEGILGPFEERLLQGQSALVAFGDALEDINTEISTANDEFPDLNAALINVSGTLAQATSDLQDAVTGDFQNSLLAQTNSARGLGIINSISGLIDQRGINESDARALGLDSNATAGELFDAQVHGLLRNSSLGDISKILGSGQLSEDEGATAILEAALAQRVRLDLIEQEKSATLLLIDAKETELTLLERNESAARNASNRLRSVVAANERSLSSPESPGDVLKEATSQFDRALSLATDDDIFDDKSQDAIRILPDLQKSLLAAALENFGADKRFYDVFRSSQSDLLGIALDQESVAEQQLSVLESILEEISSLESQVNSELGSFGSSFTRVGDTDQFISNTGFDLGKQPEKALQILNTLLSAGAALPSGFGEGQVNSLRNNNGQVDALLRALGFAEGGLIPNTAFSQPNLDSVPVMATPGEFVIRKASVNAIGPRVLAQMNATGATPGQEGILRGLYAVAGAVDRLAGQQASEHAESVSAVHSVSEAIDRGGVLAGSRA